MSRIPSITLGRHLGRVAIGLGVLGAGAFADDFAPRPDERQLPYAMHSEMSERPTITVGRADADLVGADNRALRAAVDYVAGLGGGTVEIGEGEYPMRDSLHQRSNVTVRGRKGKTILRKADAAVSPLALDGDFGEQQVTVRDPAGFAVGAGVASGEATPADAVGIFEGHADVGTVLHPGTAAFDAGNRTYSLAGSGENMWLARDAFHFAWKKTSGDLALAADVAFPGAGKNPHRKACLMIRQSLDEDSAYVDIALHGDGLTSLQFRSARGDATHEVQANVSSPRRLRLEKRKGYALMSLASGDEDLHFSGAAVRIAFDEPFYVGIGVCAHDKGATERAVFSDVDLTADVPATSGAPTLYSTLETQTISSTDRRVVHVTPTRIEAPNWTRDGDALIYNSGGRIYRIPVAGGTPEAIDTGFAVKCNNDHGISPDGTLLAISDNSQGARKSLIYTLPITGGTPRPLTPTGPSYWHGWSPDGKTLAFCGERDGEFDVYTIPAAGGPETRLTTATGLDDGPDYSPDGKWIYFNSLRTGSMQVWRMRPDGSDQEPVTSDEFNNWFPHPSPDGRSLVFISFDKEVAGHPANQDVSLRMLTLSSGKVRVLGRFLGGQGTINVPSWSPDGRKIAFVTYQSIP